MTTNILYAEDLEDDVFLMKAAFKATQLPYNLHVVADGNEAIQYLKGEHRLNSPGNYAVPAIVLIDTYMPQVSGHKVLEWIRSNPKFQELPVHMLSSVVRAEDKIYADSLIVDGCWTKSPLFENWLKFVKKIHRSIVQRAATNSMAV